MDKHTEQLLDELDSAVFSSDTFLDKESLERLQYYVNRWQRESQNIQTFLEQWDEEE